MYCRDGHFSSLGKFQKELIEFEYKSVDMPYDSDCIHEDILSLSMEWNDKELEAIKKAITNVTTKEKKFMMSLAPQVNIL